MEVRGGVGMEKFVGRAAAEDGGRYVMPIALWRPDTSSFAGMKAMVASPGKPPSAIGGM